MPENPPEKAKKSKKLTITEKNPPKKPPRISEKVLFAPDCFSLCQSVLAGLVGLCYNEGGWRRQSHRQPIRCFGTCTGALVGRPVLFYCLSMIPCNRLRNSLRLSHSLASISSSECALDFGLAQSGNVLLSQPGNRNSRAVRSFAIPAFISLNRPQGALDFGSKYNVTHWSG